MTKWIKPTIDTKFHIDFDWWEQNNENFRVYLWSHLCTDCQKIFQSHQDTEEIDWIDPDTARVTRVDALWHSLQTCCSHKPDYITEQTPTIDAILRVFLANGNIPLSPMELYEAIGKRSPSTLLRMLTHSANHRGIKPYQPRQKKKR
ncbi:MAG: hypothetical protein ACOYZ7_08655 [Chloroflexota bacterium]